MKQKDALKGRYSKLALRLKISKVRYTGGIYDARKGMSFLKRKIIRKHNVTKFLNKNNNTLHTYYLPTM